MWGRQRKPLGVVWAVLLALVLAQGVSLAVNAAAFAAPAAQEPQRIQFAPGATGATVDGYLGEGQATRYVLRALANQSMTVQSWYESAPVIVTIFDQHGNVLGTASGRRHWTGTLPYTGDYYFTVASPYNRGTYYALRIEITYTAPSPNPDPAPERIRFDYGATSASVTGYLPPASTRQYVLRALNGQRMTVQTWRGSGPYQFSIQGSDGAVLGSAAGGDTWAGFLPTTQDYLITLRSPADAPPATYGLMITIVTPEPTPRPTPGPPSGSVQEIRFPPGATYTTVWGYVDSMSPRQYVLTARRNQVMTIQLRTDQGRPARVSIATARGIFLGAANQGETWSGVLPNSGEYYLTIQAPADARGDGYSLWVGIR